MVEPSVGSSLDVFLLFAAAHEHRVFLYNLIHAVDALVIFLETADLSSQQVDLALHVVNADLEVIVLVDQLDVLFLVAEDVAFLVINITSESRALAVPEVYLVAVLTCTLLKEYDLRLYILAVNLSLIKTLLKLKYAFH